MPELKTRRAAFASANGLARAAIVVFVAAIFMSAAHRLDEARTGETMTPAPETVLVPPVPEEEPMPALAIASRPRRARTDVSMVARAEAPRPTLFARATIESIREPSESVAVALPTVVATAASVVSVADSTPVAIPPVTMASPTMESAPVEIAAITVPPAGLMHQAP